MLYHVLCLIPFMDASPFLCRCMAAQICACRRRSRSSFIRQSCAHFSGKVTALMEPIARMLTPAQNSNENQILPRRSCALTSSVKDALTKRADTPMAMTSCAPVMTSTNCDMSAWHDGPLQVWLCMPICAHVGRAPPNDAKIESYSWCKIQRFYASPSMVSDSLHEGLLNRFAYKNSVALGRD